MHAVKSKTVLLQEGLLQYAPGGQNKPPIEDQLDTLHLPWPANPFSLFCAAHQITAAIVHVSLQLQESA